MKLSLDSWFSRNARWPLTAVAALVSLLWCGFAAWSVHSKSENQKILLAQLIDTMSIALAQKNGVLTESVLQSAKIQLAATSTALCHDNRVFAATNYTMDLCTSKHNTFDQKLRVAIPGNNGLDFVVHSPIISPGAEQVCILIVALSVVAFALVLIWRIQVRFQKHILWPLREGLLLRKPLEILELEEIRIAYANMQTIETEMFVTRAVFERNQQIAHDIRSPLSALNLLSSMDTNLSELQRSVFLSALERITSISDDLLKDETTPKAGYSGSKVQSFELLPTLQKLIVDKKFEVGQNKIDITYLASPCLRAAFIRGDQIEFARVVSNLINNAIEAMDFKGLVEVFAIRVDNNIASISFNDHGKGIPDFLQDRLGERGLSYGKPKGCNGNSGHGLGFYHAKRFAESCEGNLTVESKLGRGTKITLNIPIDSAC